MKLNPFFAVVPALLALAACNAPTTETADETGTIDSELNSQVRYIVAFGNDQAAGRAALASANARVVLELPSVNAAAVTLPARAVAALQNNPNFEYIEEDVLRYPLAQTVPYGITLTQVDQIPLGATAKKVCVIDSGLAVSHEDLGGNTYTGYPTSGSSNQVWNVDGCGHGTHVTGTIAAQNNALGVIGVNSSGIAIHMVRVFGNDCAWAYASTLADAADRCRQAGANVVSMSLGGGAKSRTEENMFKSLSTSGILSIAAAGNAGNTTMSYPASYPIVMSVAAVDANKALATFSQRNREVDIAAPGVAVLSTVPWVAVNTVSVGGSTYSGNQIEGAATSSGTTGALADGGLCDSVGSWAGKVVLCQRGVIAFVDKVNNVKNGGGVAAVIYNNVPGGFSGTLGTGVTSTISAISISMEDGQAIIASGGVGQSSTVVSLPPAPGSGYEAWDGTSMATPHVSGIAALIWSRFPAKTNLQVRAALEATAQDLGAAGRDNSFGNGLVQANAALNYLGTH